MNLIELSQTHFGPLALPLLACALLAGLILIERFVLLLVNTLRGQTCKKAMTVLQTHQEDSETVRAQVAEMWLVTQQRSLLSGVRLLHIVALVAPLLGLLGTVLGLIQVFDALGEHTGPINPALLAEGLGVAMKTTAAGLVIAVPALVGVHGFQLWADHLIAEAQTQLNAANLQLQGVAVSPLAAPQSKGFAA
ncbi:MAG: MotA/TolQ/ExbB proton channel family protein [Pontibacterium sp.]